MKYYIFQNDLLGNPNIYSIKLPIVRRTSETPYYYIHVFPRRSISLPC